MEKPAPKGADFFFRAGDCPETVNDAAVQVVTLSNITFFTRKTNLFYLELSKILLYYHNIDGEQRRGSPVCLFDDSILFGWKENAKKSEQKFGKSKNFAYLCINEMR